ncbi:MAG: endonuclease/exonuclease/phosphatase family protein [Anaerolineaceae bacterium]|nr:endonuclease/exonuclease/phosphatase family protein [Anaerolineaceae bacterium]
MKPGAGIWRVIAISLCVLFGLQAGRALLPQLVYFNFEGWTGTRESLVGLYALIIVGLIAATPVVMRYLGLYRVFSGLLVGLALLRIAMQVSFGGVLLLVTTATFVLGAAALYVGALWLGWVDGRARVLFGVGLWVGFALDTALNGAFLTWDTVWQENSLTLALTLLPSMLLLVAGWQLRASPAVQEQSRSGVSFPALTLLFLLQMFALNNPAYIAAQGGFSLPLAIGVALLGVLVALVLGVWWITYHQLSRALKIGLIALLIAALVLLNEAGNGLVALMVILAQGSTGILFFTALWGELPVHKRPTVWRQIIAVGTGTLLFFALLVFFYGSDLIQLPIPTDMAGLGLAGALLAFGLWRVGAKSASTIPDWRFMTLPGVLLVIPVWLVITQPALPTHNPDTASFRLMSYNIHQGVNTDGWVDLVGLAQAIEAQNPDVVILQEVTRGQIGNGSTDSLGWLSWRLNMPAYFGPATDQTFGNAILTRLPVESWDTGLLPPVKAERRSYIRVMVNVGVPVTIIGTHLNHQSAENRIPQAEWLLNVWGGAGFTVIAGDMNAQPESQEIALFRDAGLTSAQDVAGDPASPTFSSTFPNRRIDWIFGTSELMFSDFLIPQTTASDHLPLVVTVAVGDGG